MLSYCKIIVVASTRPTPIASSSIVTIFIAIALSFLVAGFQDMSNNGNFVLTESPFHVSKCDVNDTDQLS